MKKPALATRHATPRQSARSSDLRRAAEQSVATQGTSLGVSLLDKVLQADHEQDRFFRAETNGLPQALRSGAEQLSGVALSDVAVHYNSPNPAKMGVFAHAQGTDIHLGPGQERHLAHEAWHVVQQRQGRVQASAQAKEQSAHCDQALEHEADIMGEKAERLGTALAVNGGTLNGGTLKAASFFGAPSNVIQAKGPHEEPPLPIDPAARDKITELSLPQNKMGRKGMRAQAVVDLFLRAGVKITKQQAFNWLQYGKINPFERSADPTAGAPGNFEPVRNNQVVDEWNAQLAQANAGNEGSTGEVTTSGDGFQIGGMVDDSSGGGRSGTKAAEVKRDPLRQKAWEAIHAYDPVDRSKLQINALFSDKERDVELIKSLRERGAYVANDGSNNAPLGATYVLAKCWEDNKGKTVRQFAGTGIIVDKSATTVTAGGDKEPVEKWTTMNNESLNARTETALQQVRFTSRVFAKHPVKGSKERLEILGWFIPEFMPKIGEISGQAPAELKDAYDQTNPTGKRWLDEKQEAEESRRFALSGHAWMGADWHANENYGYKLVTVDDLDENNQPRYKMNGDKFVLDKKGEKIRLKKQVRVRIDKAIGKDGAKKQALAYKIYAGNPDTVRNPASGKKGSYFTTCVETANKILSEYGIDTNIFGGLMAPVYQDPKQKTKPRDSAIFKYLKQSGAWVWGEKGFVPKQGDVFLTGTYTDSINARDKTYGLWSFQHVGIVANTKANDDGTYTILSQDGGKGMAMIGEDKTGYTIRNYDPETRLMSGASPKMVIGVWRPALLKAALQHLPKEIKDSLKPGQNVSYERLFGSDEDVYE